MKIFEDTHTYYHNNYNYYYILKYSRKNVYHKSHPLKKDYIMCHIFVGILYNYKSHIRLLLKKHKLVVVEENIIELS